MPTNRSSSNASRRCANSGRRLKPPAHGTDPSLLGLIPAPLDRFANFHRVPFGYVQLATGGVALDPDEQARAVVQLLFDKFAELGTLYGLFRYLIRNSGHAVSRKAMLEDVWNLDEHTETRAIDNFIVRLRRYIEKDPAKPRHLITIRGLGYQFVPTPD